MKNLTYILLSVLWILSTVILGITFIGAFVFFFVDDNDEAYWFTYGKMIFDKINF
jgi:hypothetical protein